MRDPIPEEVMQIAVSIGHVQYLHVLPFEYRAALSEAIAGALMKEREERDRLREALKPFADAGGMLPLTFGPDNEPVSDDEEVSISCVGYPLGEVTVADLTRAYIVLSPTIEGSKT